MKYFKCDLCGDEVGADWELKQLSSEVATEEIKEICITCEKRANKVLGKKIVELKRLEDDFMKGWLCQQKST